MALQSSVGYGGNGFQDRSPLIGSSGTGYFDTGSSFAARRKKLEEEQAAGTAAPVAAPNVKLRSVLESQAGGRSSVGLGGDYNELVKRNAASRRLAIGVV
jgi:hypothetical protein